MTIDYFAIEDEIIRRLGPSGIREQYERLGCVFTGYEDPNGFNYCKSLAAPDESNASAAANFSNGLYVDRNPRGPTKPLKLWGAMAEYNRSDYRTWQDARAHLAKLVNVEIPTRQARKKWSAHEQIDLIPLTRTLEMAAFSWMHKHKHGITLSILDRVGCVFGTHPSRLMIGDRKTTPKRVLAVPVYGPTDFTDKEPQAYQLYHLDGSHFKIWKDQKLVDGPKVKSIGPTGFGLMGKEAIKAIKRRDKQIEFILKVAGPSDLLAVQSAIPEDKLDKWLVIANASGEDGCVDPVTADLLSPYQVFIVNDCDDTGIRGDFVWLSALGRVCKDVRVITLPYGILPKHGNDSRDFLIGTAVGTETRSVASPKGVDRDGKPPDKEAQEKEVSPP